MAWITAPKKFSYSSQGAQAWGSLEYYQEDGLLTGQGLDAAEPWIVVPVDPRTQWPKPVAINTARLNQAAGQTFPTHALVTRDPDLFLWHDIDNNPGNASHAPPPGRRPGPWPACSSRIDASVRSCSARGD